MLYIIVIQMQQKSVCALPYVLSLNCQLESETDREFWRTRQASCPTPSSWVPLSMEISLGEGRGMSVREVGESEEGPPCSEVTLPHPPLRALAGPALTLPPAGLSRVRPGDGGGPREGGLDGGARQPGSTHKSRALLPY